MKSLPYRDGYIIECSTSPSKAELERLSAGLTGYNRAQIPDKGHTPILLTLQTTDGSFAGGLSAHVSYRWLFVEVLWVAEQARLQGYGSRLIRRAEEEAGQVGGTNAWVDTFSFQARRFYEKLGYVVFGELEDYPPGHSRYFLRKRLGVPRPSHPSQAPGCGN